MTNKLLTSIDIGTNTFRLLIGTVSQDHSNGAYSINEVHSERVVTRLGEGLNDSGHLSEEAIARSIAVLKHFSNLISQYDITDVSAIATSALREADNSAVFIKKAMQTAGLKINIVSGEREAELSSAGMFIDMIRPQESLLIDIGGGSTELILTREHPVFMQSIPMGVVYLSDKYLDEDPPSRESLLKMEREIMQGADKFHEEFKDRFSSVPEMIGTAGTISSLAAIKHRLQSYDSDIIHKTVLSFNDIENIYSQMVQIKTAERKKYLPFEASRLDIIVPGNLILLAIMKKFHINSLTVSSYGLREGILIDLYKKLNGTTGL